MQQERKVMREFDLPVAIIGAGPYGVSTAAYLHFHGVKFRIFGSPMQRWRTQMPVGMILKSEGFASNLADPAGYYTLQQYCKDEALPYEGVPVTRGIFTNYAMAFQQRLVPMVEDVTVTRLERYINGFRLHLSTGEKVRAGKVIVATGLSYFEYTPASLANMPAELLTHSNSHHDLSKFKGREVVVVGSGQSALETAALLNEEGAFATLLARSPTIEWHEPPGPSGPRSLWQRLRRPMTPMGAGLKLWFYGAPTWFYHLPERFRTDVVRTYGWPRSKLAVLGPSGSWWLRERVEGRVTTLLGHSIRSAQSRNGKAVLHIAGPDQTLHQLTADDVIAATGYRYNIASLPFLDPQLTTGLRCVQQVPRLSPHFESSIPGLFFTGISSVYNFGPPMRFICGAQYAAERVASAIVRGRRDSPSSVVDVKIASAHDPA
jgi:FAD-dependent urate hydroxylase